MSFNTGYYNQPASLVGTLVFPGRKSVLPASTVPEYPAQPYPVLNFSSSANEMNLALGDGGYTYNNNFNSQNFQSGFNFNNNPFMNMFMNFFNNQNSITENYPQYNQPQNYYGSNNSYCFNSSDLNYQEYNQEQNAYEANDLSLFDPLPLADPNGNQIPFNNATVLEGLFGNVHAAQSILSRYVADTMPTDKDAPGYTWKYTLPGQNYSNNTNTNYDINNETEYQTSNTTANNDNSNDLSLFDPLPLADPNGNQIPFNNAVVLDGLFGNVHAAHSILSRYVADTMPTDKDAPGYTWKYTLPGN